MSQVCECQRADTGAGFHRQKRKTFLKTKQNSDSTSSTATRMEQTRINTHTQTDNNNKKKAFFWSALHEELAEFPRKISGNEEESVVPSISIFLSRFFNNRENYSRYTSVFFSRSVSSFFPSSFPWNSVEPHEIPGHFISVVEKVSFRRLEKIIFEKKVFEALFARRCRFHRSFLIFRVYVDGIVYVILISTSSPPPAPQNGFYDHFFDVCLSLCVSLSYHLIVPLAFCFLSFVFWDPFLFIINLRFGRNRPEAPIGGDFCCGWENRKHNNNNNTIALSFLYALCWLKLWKKRKNKNFLFCFLKSWSVYNGNWKRLAIFQRITRSSVSSRFPFPRLLFGPYNVYGFFLSVRQSVYVSVGISISFYNNQPTKVVVS